MQILFIKKFPLVNLYINFYIPHLYSVTVNHFRIYVLINFKIMIYFLLNKLKNILTKLRLP